MRENARAAAAFSAAEAWPQGRRRSWNQFHNVPSPTPVRTRTSRLEGVTPSTRSKSPSPSPGFLPTRGTSPARDSQNARRRVSRGGSCRSAPSASLLITQRVSDDTGSTP
jgi:hypothetical protein